VPAALIDRRSIHRITGTPKVLAMVVKSGPRRCTLSYGTPEALPGPTARCRLGAGPRADLDSAYTAGAAMVPLCTRTSDGRKGGMYKLEPVVARWELVPTLRTFKERSARDGALWAEIGNKPGILHRQWDRFGGTPAACWRHSTHLPAGGSLEAATAKHPDHVTPRTAFGRTCAQHNVGYLDPHPSIRPKWAKEPRHLVGPKGGRGLHGCDAIIARATRSERQRDRDCQAASKRIRKSWP